MGLSMKSENGCNYPVLTCDTCNKPIEDWDNSMVAFRAAANEVVAVKVFHKVTCDPGGTMRGDSETACSEELCNYLPWLLWNHGWGVKQEYDEGARLTIDVPRPLQI